MSLDQIVFPEPTLAAQVAAKAMVEITEKWVEFWPNSEGWAPETTVSQLTEAGLKRQLSVAESLAHWPSRLLTHCTDGELLMAWANLGSVIEGGLKVFFCVYGEDWLNDDKAPTQYVSRGKREKILPSSAMFDKLIIFSAVRNILKTDEIEYLKIVRDQRNLIHPLKEGNVRNENDFNCAVIAMSGLYQKLDAGLPYPEPELELRYH